MDEPETMVAACERVYDPEGVENAVASANAKKLAMDDADSVPEKLTMAAAACVYDSAPPASEKIELGPYLGEYDLIQWSGKAYTAVCKESEEDEDNTGLRLHGGSHVLIRFLVQHRIIMDGVHMVELGCGTGVAAVAAVRCMAKSGMMAKSYLITDGNEQAVQLCDWNIAQEVPNAEWVTCKKLLWCSEDTESLMQVSDCLI